MIFKKNYPFYFFYLGLIFCFISLGCNNTSENKTKEPEGLIKKETMVSILTEMHLLEGADALKLSVAKNITSSQEKIFFKYGTNREYFISSLNFYKTRLIELQEIYNKVTEELTTTQTNIAYKP